MREADDHRSDGYGSLPEPALDRAPHAAPDSGPTAALAAARRRIAALEECAARLERENTEAKALSEALSAELEETNRGVVALFSEEHELALMLQRTFLPARLPEVAGVELAVRYLPATGQSEIGGDFYEALDTPAGLLLAVGDVAGHSLQAAVVMGELRHALRAYAVEGHRPQVLLTLLDRLLTGHRPGWTATLCIALIDTGHRRLHIANAGHLPPLLIDPGTDARYVHPHGPLLGVGLPQPEAASLPVTAGTRLLMVTDGLIETPRGNLQRSLDELRHAAACAPADPQALCDTLLQTFGGRQIDDIVVFAAALDQP